jgi:hypothetical protein
VFCFVKPEGAEAFREPFGGLQGPVEQKVVGPAAMVIVEG